MASVDLQCEYRLGTVTTTLRVQSTQVIVEYLGFYTVRNRNRGFGYMRSAYVGTRTLGAKVDHFSSLPSARVVRSLLPTPPGLSTSEPGQQPADSRSPFVERPPHDSYLGRNLFMAQCL